MLRSRGIVLLILAVPLLGIVAEIAGVRIRHIFFPAALTIAWLMMFVRCRKDRLQGYSQGIDTTPASGLAAFMSRLTAGVVTAAIQWAILTSFARII